MRRLGIDLGGTKIEAAVLDEGGAVLGRERVRTPRDSYDDTLDAIAQLVSALERAHGRAESIGVAMPGSISPHTGLVRNANSTWLNGRDLSRDVEQRLGRSVRFANDANCFALSEAVDGAGSDARVVFGVILGTGVGGGLVFEKRVWDGHNGVAGEWGHNPLPSPRDYERPGPPCYCGRRGCIETFLSGPGLARDHEGATGQRLSPPEIVSRALAGADRDCEATLARYEERLGCALAVVVNLVDPDVIVLGGGLSNMARLYVNLPARVAPHVFADRALTPIRPPRHGDASGVRGAAWLGAR